MKNIREPYRTIVILLIVALFAIAIFSIVSVQLKLLIIFFTAVLIVFLEVLSGLKSKNKKRF